MYCHSRFSEMTVLAVSVLLVGMINTLQGGGWRWLDLSGFPLGVTFLRQRVLIAVKHNHHAAQISI